MSLTNFDAGTRPLSPSLEKITVRSLLERKHSRIRICCLTAYDYASARLVDEAGVDLVLVGDSVAMVAMGHENTLAITMDEMLHHTRAARRGVKHALLIADMPYGSFHTDTSTSVANAVRFLKEAGAEGVKLEGGRSRIDLIARLTEAEIPVLGHLGLTPQSVHRMGGYKVQGKTLPAMEALIEDAHALVAAGVFGIVLEGIPRELAARITAEIAVPTIGIGAGPDCDGQILVFHDLLNLTFAPAAKFVRRYADAAALIRAAVSEYRGDVQAGAFPSDEESYHLPAATAAALGRAPRPAPVIVRSRRKA